MQSVMRSRKNKGESQSDLKYRKILFTATPLFQASESEYLGQPSVSSSLKWTLQRPIGYDNTIHRKVAEIAAITENKCKLKTVSSKKADAELKQNELDSERKMCHLSLNSC